MSIFFVTNINFSPYTLVYQQIYNLIYNLPPNSLLYHGIFPLTNGLSLIQIDLAPFIGSSIRDQLDTWINQISFNRVTAQLVTEFPLSVELSSNLETAFIQLVNEYYKVNVDQVQSFTQTLDNKYITHFWPYSQNQNIYYDPRYNYNFNAYFDLSDILGYHYLSHDTLAPLAIHQLVQSKEFPLQQLDLNTIDGLTLSRLTEDAVTFTRLQSVVSDTVTNLRKQGYTTLAYEHRDFLAELALFWPFTLSEQYPQIYVKTDPDADFFISPTTWLHKSLSTIRQGDLPTFRFSGKWLDAHTEPYTALTGDNQVRPLILYSALLAYRLLITDSPPLYNFLQKLFVSPDLSITANFCSYKQALDFQQNYYTIIKNIDGYILIPCSTPIECLLYRYYIHQTYPERNYIVLGLEIDDHIYCLINTRVREEIDIDFDHDKVRADLEKAMKPFLHPYAPLETLFTNPNLHGNLTPLQFRLGLYGYFDIGSLPGLVNSPYQNLSLSTGTISTLVQDSKDVEVYVDSTFLFSLTLESATKSALEPLVSSVKDLWRKGKILNPWAWYLYQNTGLISHNLKDLLPKVLDL